ncbi:protease complex subunit PrcB family protein [Aquisalimonas sp.]|uniref:protease complex subunit PrcB family protein n=1 Tax=unclassified Aquisalimonas TaxID=2644645 RepID=UPI0025BE6D3E|nr:protease complex subunit PrcB family protein [Aquisalimonas sp.]
MVVALQGCLSTQSDREPAAVEVLGQGNRCGDLETGARWIEPGALEGLDLEHKADRALLLISQGERPTGGYGVNLDETTVDGDTVIVYLRLQAPGDDELVTQALTRPCLVLGIPRDAAVVELRQREGGVLASLEVPERDE